MRSHTAVPCVATLPSMCCTQAEKLLSEMLDAGLTPNVITYTSLMVVLRRGGQAERAVKILDLMKSKVMM